MAGALLTLALPAAGLRLTLPDAGYDAPGSQPRVAYDLLDAGFGPGFNGPLLVTADISRTLDVQGALTALDGAFTGVPVSRRSRGRSRTRRWISPSSP